MQARVLKDTSKIEQGIFLFVVYEPDVLDAHGDWATMEEIEKACYNFNRKQKFSNVDEQHSFQKVDAEILESYISPVDMEIGNEKITKGTWLVKIQIHDQELVHDYRAGKKTGVSMGGKATLVDEEM